MSGGSSCSWTHRGHLKGYALTIRDAIGQDDKQHGCDPHRIWLKYPALVALMSPSGRNGGACAGPHLGPHDVGRRTVDGDDRRGLSRGWREPVDVLHPVEEWRDPCEEGRRATVSTEERTSPLRRRDREMTGAPGQNPEATVARPDRSTDAPAGGDPGLGRGGLRV